jgi:hypothetical protein
VKNFAGLMVPDAWYRHRLQRKLREAKLRPDYEYICRRVDYYNKLSEPWKVSDCNYEKREPSYFHYTGPLNGYRRSVFCTAYYFDQHDVTRWFPPHLRWNFCPGDVYFTPRQPTVVKSRLLVTSNHNSVILKLDKLRHFMFVHDKKSFREKKDMAIFRGKIRESRVRELFMRMYFGHPMCDCGIVGKNDKWPRKWSTPKKTISEHLDYKFIMAMEGNDVASNLKWVMSSNSIAVMTHPTCETWFMEGTLIPNYHYIEVRDDFSDLPEKLQYYIDHPEEAERIIRNAHEYVAQFWDKEREELIGLMVMQRYFETSGQL